MGREAPTGLGIMFLLWPWRWLRDLFEMFEVAMSTWSFAFRFACDEPTRANFQLFSIELDGSEPVHPHPT